MLFNPDISKQAVEVIFSNKNITSAHLPLIFNGIPVKLVKETKHLGMILGSNLSYKSHLENKLAKANQGLGIMIQLKKWVSHRVLEVVYKLYVRPHLDYGDVLYHSANPNKNIIFEPSTHSSFLKKVEEIQYSAAKIITGAWQGTSTEKLYKILGWESLNCRRIMRKLNILHETFIDKHPNYLYDTFKTSVYPVGSRLGNQLTLKNIPCKKGQISQRIPPLHHSRQEPARTQYQKQQNQIYFQKKNSQHNSSQKVPLFRSFQQQ